MPTLSRSNLDHGWVELPRIPEQDGLDDFMHEHFPVWVDRLALLGEHKTLRALGSRIIGALTGSKADHNAERGTE